MTNEAAWAEEELRERIGELLVHGALDLQSTLFRPVGIVLPLSLGPGLESVYGFPIIRGDRVALLYEPLRR